jgi:hypothetical protein
MIRSPPLTMRPIGHAVPAAIAELLQAAPMSPGKMTFAWRTAVGPMFEKVTEVRLDGQVLLVDAATVHWAREIRRATPLIVRRLDALLGAGTVTSLSVRARQAPRG